MALGLGIYHWGCGPYQVCTNDESGLTLIFFTARPNLIPNAFIFGKILKRSFFYNCLSEIIILAKNVKPIETLVLYKHQRSS